MSDLFKLCEGGCTVEEVGGVCWDEIPPCGDYFLISPENWEKVESEVAFLKRALDDFLLLIEEAVGEIELRCNDGKIQLAVLTCDDPEEPTSTYWLTVGKPITSPDLYKYLQDREAGGETQ